MKKKEIEQKLDICKEKVRDLSDALNVLIENPTSMDAKLIEYKVKLMRDVQYQVPFGSRKIAEKPPLGVTPHRIWQEERYADLGEAIKRYKDAGWQVPQTLLDEFTNLNNKLINETSNPFKEAIVKNLKERLSKSNSNTRANLLLSILDDISRMENNH